MNSDVSSIQSTTCRSGKGDILTYDDGFVKFLARGDFFVTFKEGRFNLLIADSYIEGPCASLTISHGNTSRYGDLLVEKASASGC